MPNDAATPDEVQAIALRVGDGLLDDLWTLYRQEVQRMPEAWDNLTEDEREEIQARAFKVFEDVVRAMAMRSATAAIAKGRPTVLGTLDVVKLGDDAQIVVKAKVAEPALHALIGQKGAAVLVVLAGGVGPAQLPKDDKTPDMFDAAAAAGTRATPFPGDPRVIVDSTPGGGVTVGDGPAPE